MLRTTLALVALALAIPTAPAALASEHRADRLILIPEAGTIFTVEGHYPQGEETCEFKRRKPLRAKYRGRLILEREPDGRVRMINSLSFDNYLGGLAEVPLSWPQAALRAQVIAARSYALHAVRRDRDRADERGYDICSTDQCQVYRGATVELGAFGERWTDAVRATRARVLTYRGSPIQAFYFSTSDGRTRRSFPGGTPQPWLPSVRAHDEDAPLARWTSRIRVGDLSRILDRSGDWPGGRIDAVRVTDSAVVISGPAGRRSIELPRFRIAMNGEAPCVDPERYPNPKGSAVGTRLPQTVPSTSFSLERRGDELIARGRGWGHFVGMSQWGANALAERGWSANRILDHFYGAARVSRVREPERIRVLAAEDLRVVRIAIDGGVTVRTGTGSRLRAASAFEVRGGSTLQVRRGRGPSLDPVLSVEARDEQVTGRPGETVRVRIESSRPIRARAEILRGDAVVARTPRRSLELGRRSLRIPLEDDNGAPLAGGEYTLVIEGYDGLDRVRTEPIGLRVVAPSPSPTPDRTATGRPTASGSQVPRAVPLAVAAAALLTAIALLVRNLVRRPANRT